MAQEREKTRIVLASILKPVDDTRMAEKMGVTLASSGYDVTVIGYESAGQVPPGISYKSLGTFRRLGWQRYLARWKVLRQAWAIRPAVFIFSTYELIVPALVLKVTLGTRIVYDVRENYFRNIRYSEGLPSVLRWPLAIVVRGIEKLTAPMIDHFFLAEKGYDAEFRFHRGGWTILENKAISPGAGMPINRTGWNLLFSGTLSESTGVFRAIRLAEDLHKLQPSLTLTIAGYAASREVQKRICKEAEGNTFVTLIGIDHLVPHSVIVEQIQNARAGIIAYPRMPHTVNSTPTKLFEYLSARLPILCEPGWPWVSRFAGHHAFVPVDFEKPEPAAILDVLKNPDPFFSSPVNDANWESEVPRLLDAIENIV